MSITKEQHSQLKTQCKAVENALDIAYESPALIDIETLELDVVELMRMLTRIKTEA